MIIKSFTAESAAAALKKVRSEMGGDAVVLKTRESKEPDGGIRVEITACLDKPSVAQATAIFPDRQTEPVRKTEPVENNRLGDISSDEEMVTGKKSDIYERLAAIENRLTRLSSDDEAGMEETAEENDSRKGLRETLKDADLPKDYVKSLFNMLEGTEPFAKDREGAVRELLSADLAEIIQPGFNLDKGDKVVFNGLPASGKTSVMGKTAARLVLNKKKARLVSLDNLKVGAFEEINSYADLLGLGVSYADAGDQDKKKKNDEVLLVDTPPIPRQPEKIKELQERIEALQPDLRVLVLSALQRTDDIVELLESLREFKPTHLVMAMTDLTRRYGALLPVCRELNIKLAFVTCAPGGIGRLEVPDVDVIVRSLLNEEVEVEQA
jgi:flagellar biosynthesis protein FlhF